MLRADGHTEAAATTHAAARRLQMQALLATGRTAISRGLLHFMRILINPLIKQSGPRENDFTAL